ncbi:CAAX protease self-immunity [Dyella sp. OK004]|uniref:CPBP family glutamic-type intramembrane protease n=1 Tax=Dyella sp. OK004 TaxID=1855292 RepID=UPI0008E029B1|nr:CPBP family glutamic-type intramembrane protease [Dyella sp. OK004]SFS14710.1 CAAX protease self-immunity [Dyella sp. OK004]
MKELLRPVATAAGFALAVVLLMLALQMLSARVTQAHLQHEAERRLYALQNREPLWSWSLRRPRDLVAGHPFGAATAARDGSQLLVTSHDGSAYDLGLPVMQPIDLVHWPLLRLRAESSADGTLGLVVQASVESPTCVAASAAALHQGIAELTIDLRNLAWRSADGGVCAPPGILRHMLRLRPQLPSGASLRLREVALVTDQPAPAIDTRAAIGLPSDPWLAGQRIDQLRQSGYQSRAPLFQLPTMASAETWLALRDRLHGYWPAALLVPSGAELLANAHEPMPVWFGWLACGTYVLLLIGCAVWPPPGKARSWLEIVIAMAGPLWLMAGLQWGLHLSIPGVIAFGAALSYAVWIEWRQRPHAWHWLSRNWRDWAMPLALLPIALGLIAWLGHDLHPLDGRHALIYLGWATLQQWLMLAVVLHRLESLHWPRPVIWLATAALFALLHSPNGVLMQLCFLAELWWAWCFMRSRALLPIALAHAGCALLVESGLAGGLLRSLEVSARFFL